MSNTELNEWKTLSLQIGPNPHGTAKYKALLLDPAKEESSDLVAVSTGDTVAETLTSLFQGRGASFVAEQLCDPHFWDDGEFVPEPDGED